MVLDSEPSGTDADIPTGTGGESVIDIFILSKDARDSRQLAEQLANQGYRITPFSDASELLERLRDGKPNLLICDATGPEQEGYQVCREIKADANLWNIPVLLITGVSGLGDLLIVLDSNADNFIARPWDAQYLVSLIELMLASPVEKPDPEKVRTQFKIRHEDQEYVITADRRKLLEFLLSSFEIAMGRAADLVQVQSERDTLQSTMESRIVSRTSELSTEVARLQTLISGKSHELEVTKKALADAGNDADALRASILDNEKTLAAKGDDLARIREELETTRAHLAEEEDAVRTLGTEKEELEHALRGDVDAINRDLVQTRAELEAAQKEVAELSSQRSDLEHQLTGLSSEYEQAKKTLAASAVEIGQLRSDLAGEKNRASAAEQEVKSVLQEKAKSEEDLREMIGDITAKATQQSQEVLRLTDELAAEQKHKESIDQEYAGFQQETAKKEAGYIAERDSLAGHHNELQLKYDALTESFGAERQKAVSRDSDVARLTEEKQQLENDLVSAKGQIDTLVSALDEEKRLRAGAELGAKNTLEARNDELRELAGTVDALRQELESRRSELSLAGKERDENRTAYKDACDRLVAMELAKGQADKVARSAAAEMELIREQLETERRLRHGAEENAAAAARAKENIGQNLQAAVEANDTARRELQAKIDELSGQLSEEREARRTAADKLEQAVAGLEEAAGIIENLRHAEADLQTSEVRQRALEEQLRSSEREQAQKEAAIQSLTDDLGQVSSALVSEKDLRRAAEHAYEELKGEFATLKCANETLPSRNREESAGEQALVETKEPDLPAVIPMGAQVLAVNEAERSLVSAQQSAKKDEMAADSSTPDPSTFRTVEDLFEEPKELDIHDLPDAASAPNEILPEPVSVEEELKERVLHEDGAEEVEVGETPDDETGQPDEEAECGAADEPEVSVQPHEEILPDAGTMMFGRQQWLDLIKWAHNAETLRREDRIRMVKLGRLIQRGKRLTKRQEEQLGELVTLAHAMGYRPKD